ncbi:aminoglycoside phosphotransferase family protein [Paenibacillus lautus]|uniref:aminoglycoside phosphotransferase family protein n=1 Tax=Paenibacillus lautus TaxID=1401 RepID=UPI0039865C9F
MEQLEGILKEYYGLDRTRVVPQKGGWAALAYQVQTDGHGYFLKVYEKSRASTPKWTARIDDYVPILLWLGQHSLLKGKIPVPILTKDGLYQCEDDEGIYLLYEYIMGDTIADLDLTSVQVRQLAEIITELHQYGDGIPFKTNAIRENFEVPFLQQLGHTLDAVMPNDVREAVQPFREKLNDLMNEVYELSVTLAHSNVHMALCHTDVHHWNLMSAGHELVLIDWEGLSVAPVEADMMFFVQTPYWDEFMRIYKNTHREYEINSDALRFYQGRRKLEDVWEFIEQLLYDTQDEGERIAVLSHLKSELEKITPSV